MNEGMPKQERVFKTGETVKFPVMEGMDQLEDWTFVAMKDGQVVLNGILAENTNNGEVSSEMTPEMANDTMLIQRKVVPLEEFRKYNK